MRKVILDNNIPKGRTVTYPENVMKEIVETVDHGRTFVYLSTVPHRRLLDDVAGKCEDARIEGDTITAEIKVLETPAGKILAELLKNDIHFAFGVFGAGRVKGNYITDYKLHGINIYTT